MFGINLGRPAKTSSPAEVDTYVSLGQQEHLTPPSAQDILEGIQPTGFYPFSLSKTIVGSINKPLHRGFGVLMEIESTQLGDGENYVASCDIQSKIDGRQSSVVCLYPEQITDVAEGAELARFAISHALFDIVEGRASLSLEDIKPGARMATMTDLWQDFYGTA